MRKPHEITQLDIYPLDIPLINPFTIAVTNHTQLNNVALKITLADGSIGWGETPTLPPLTREDQSTALQILGTQAETLIGKDASQWRLISAQLMERTPLYPAVRCGLEMALFDALCRSYQIPLFQFFGGYSNRVTTDITIPICAPELAEQLARQYQQQGFAIIKTKIGQDIDSDIERIRAIRRGYQDCPLLLDANAGFSADQSLAVLAQLRRFNIEPVLLEQPVARDDWQGLARLTREAGVPIAADESCQSPQDASRIANDKLAQVINIKLSKCGVVQAMDIAAIARSNGIGLMIGAMVETRLAIGFGAHFAAGLGGFDWIDLDTALLLANDPIQGGYIASGPHYQLDVGSYGHGGDLKPEV